MRPVVLGMNNPSELHRGEALSPRPPGSSGRRLAAIAGMSVEEFEAEFDRVNLLADARVWSYASAREAGATWRAYLDGRRRVFVLGRAAWAALGLPPVGWCESHESWTLLPHPSGRCRVYNDRNMRRKVKRCLEDARASRRSTSR